MKLIYCTKCKYGVYAEFDLGIICDRGHNANYDARFCGHYKKRITVKFLRNLAKRIAKDY